MDCRGGPKVTGPPSARSTGNSVGQHFQIDPEVAGGLGRHTVMDVSVHPPVVTRLNYEFEGWLGDVILECFPCFIITAEAKRAFSEMSVSGAAFDDVEVTTSDVFEELQPDQILSVPRQKMRRIGLDRQPCRRNS